MFIPPAMRKNTLRIALRCIPVSIFSRRSLLTPYQKIRRWSKLGPLSSPAILKVVYRHSTCPPPSPANECFFSIFYPNNNCCWIFSISSATMSCVMTTISNPFLHASILVHLCPSPGPTFPSGMCPQTFKRRNDVIRHVC